MDLLITKGTQSVKLSDYNLYNIDIDDNSPAISLDKRSVKGRSGTVFGGATFTSKTIKATGRLEVDSIQVFLAKKDELNGLLLDDDPFFITKMYPSNSGFYDFETPGQKTGDFEKIGEHVAWKYRWKVTVSGAISFSFVGKAGEKLKYDVSMTFATAEMPYGQTIPKTVTLSNGSFDYNGTATLSQLEWPFVVKLTSTGNQAGFYLEISGKRFTYSQIGNINSGDVFKLTGIETTKNDVVVNAKTNYAYFAIKPTFNQKISYQTNFNGTIEILNFVEFYK